VGQTIGDEVFLLVEIGALPDVVGAAIVDEDRCFAERTAGIDVLLPLQTQTANVACEQVSGHSLCAVSAHSGHSLGEVERPRSTLQPLQDRDEVSRSI